MNNSPTTLTVTADVGPLRQRLREAGEQIRAFGDGAKTGLTAALAPLARLQTAFVAAGTVLAGGAVFKAAAEQAALTAEESIKLGRALGISAGEASVLREALQQGNTSQEEFVGAAKGLAKQLVENESGLNAMGLKTRDAAGNLRPLNELTLDAIGVLNGYKAGTDRAIAAQALFGKGFAMTSNLAEMNSAAVAETGEQMRALGLVVSQENVEAYKAFDNAGDQANLVLTGIKTTIGNAVMPVLTQLGEWFAAVGPAAVAVVRAAIGTLVGAFWALKTAAISVFSTLNAVVVQVAEPIRAVAVAFWKLLQGDFAGAKSEIANIPKVWSAAWNEAFGNIAASASETRDKIAQIFGAGTAAAAPGTGGRGAGNLLKNGDKTGKSGSAAAAPDPGFMQYYEAELAQRKAAFEQENALRQFSKEQELAYWREVQANLELTSKDRLAIAKRTATLELEIRRQSAKEQRDLDSVMVDSRRAAALAQIQFEEQQANFSRENGDITKRELLVLEEQFARRRFEIEYQALLERLELAKSDPNASPAELARIKEQMIEIERNYQLRRGEITQGVAAEQNALWNGFTGTMTSLWDKGLQAMMNGTLTWRNAWQAIMADMTRWFVSDVIGAQVKSWITEQAKLLAVKLGFMQADEAATIASSAKIVGAKATETTAVVAGDAAQAGAGAAKSQAGIPIAGPWLALAAMAMVFAAVMALGKRKSAAGGFDIPKGLNPMTQLHEEEMVLPQKYANVIRGMAGGGEGQGGGATGGMVFAPTIKAMDSRDVLRALREGGVLHKALKDLDRRYMR